MCHKLEYRFIVGFIFIINLEKNEIYFICFDAAYTRGVRQVLSLQNKNKCF